MFHSHFEGLRHVDQGDLSKERVTVVSSLLQSDLPETEKTTDRVAAEAQTLLLAGTGTTAATLTAITFHLLDSPALLPHSQTRYAP